MNSVYIAIHLLKRMFSDVKGWISNLLLPVLIMTLIVIFAGDGSSQTVKLGYANLDQGAFGEQLIGQIAKHEQYDLVEMEPSELKERVASGTFPLGILIPEQFSSGMLEGRPVPVEQLYVYKTEDAFHLEFAINRYVRQMEQTVRAVSQTGTGPGQLVETMQTILEQQAKRQVKANVTETGPAVNGNLYLVTGFMLFFVMSSIFQSLSLVLDDRARRTMMRVYTAPVRAYEIAVGNFAGSFAVGLLQITAALVITRYVLGYHYGVGFFPMLVILAFFLLASVGIGSAIAGLVKNSRNISQLNALVVTPTCMLGGCWWPVSIMPDFMQKIANFVPQRWVIDAVETMAAGEGFRQIALNLGILALFAVIFLAFGSAVLKPGDRESAS